MPESRDFAAVSDTVFIRTCSGFAFPFTPVWSSTVHSRLPYPPVRAPPPTPALNPRRLQLAHERVCKHGQTRPGLQHVRDGAAREDPSCPGRHHCHGFHDDRDLHRPGLPLDGSSNSTRGGTRHRSLGHSHRNHTPASGTCTPTGTTPACFGRARARLAMSHQDQVLVARAVAIVSGLTMIGASIALVLIEV